MNEIVDADKFVLEQVYRPYQSMLGFEKTLKKQPFDNQKTIEMLQSHNEWSNLVIDRIRRCKFKISQWVDHPVINYIYDYIDYVRNNGGNYE